MSEAVEKMADMLMAADGRMLAPAVLPALTLADAYRVQAALFDRRRLAVGGWKVALVNDTPVAAPLALTTIHASGTQLRLQPGRPLLIETELAIRLSQNLSKRATPYSRDDLLAAIDTLHPAFEVVCPRVGLPPATPLPAFLADGLANAVTVVGPGTEPGDWPIAGVLERDGEIVAQGAHPAGDPLAALLAWVNRPADALGGLCRGQLVLLGSFTGVVPLPSTGTLAYRGSFAGLALVDAVFTDVEHA